MPYKIKIVQQLGKKSAGNVPGENTLQNRNCAKLVEKSARNVAGENALRNRNWAKFARKSAGNVKGGKTPCKIEILQNLRNKVRKMLRGEKRVGK